MNDKPIARKHYKVFYPITTRWMDNDIYGHVNNVTYYSYFDSAVNRYLIEQGGLDIHNAPIVGFVVNSGCNYLSPIAYPDKIEAGLRVNNWVTALSPTEWQSFGKEKIQPVPSVILSMYL